MGPSPQSYSLPPLIGYQKHAPTHYKNPAWVYGPDKGKEKTLVSYSPGPQYKIDPDITRFGRNAKVPAYIGIKLPSQKEYKTPAPNAYAPENSRDGTKTRAPAWNHAYRTNLIKQDHTPGPGAYDHKPGFGVRVPHMQSAPQYTALGRPIDKDIIRSPGPANYSVTDPSVYKPKAPNYSQKGRDYPPDSKKIDAALRAIDYRAGKRPPAWVFGDKHSPYLTPLILPEDDTYPSPVVQKKHLKGPCRPKPPPVCEKKPCACKPTKVVCRPIKTSSCN